MKWTLFTRLLFSNRLTLTLSCAMNFLIYPHDTQECKLQMESCEYSAVQCTISNDSQYAYIFKVSCTDSLRLSHTYHAPPMPFVYRPHAMPRRVNSHMPCRAPVILWQWRVLREGSRGSRKYPNCLSYSLTDWYTSDNNFRGSPRSSRKKPNADKCPICRLWTADANSTCHAMPMPLCAVAFGSRFQNGMAVAWHGRSMGYVNQTGPHFVNRMGKTQSKHLAARHDRGTAWARHGMCELAFRVYRHATIKRFLIFSPSVHHLYFS
jgi:hypothetical protein